MLLITLFSCVPLHMIRVVSANSLGVHYETLLKGLASSSMLQNFKESCSFNPLQGTGEFSEEGGVHIFSRKVVLFTHFPLGERLQM